MNRNTQHSILQRIRKSRHWLLRMQSVIKTQHHLLPMNEIHHLGFAAIAALCSELQISVLRGYHFCPKALVRRHTPPDTPEGCAEGRNIQGTRPNRCRKIWSERRYGHSRYQSFSFRQWVMQAALDTGICIIPVGISAKSMT
jgi:hypothetical protein